jgi:hypothetical protein
MTFARFAVRCGVLGRTLIALAATSAASSMYSAAPHTQADRAGQVRPALSVTEALASFVVEPGYRIDAVAAEPLVQSPVAVAFDDRGRMYVAENRGYPDPLEGSPRPRRRVSSRC